MIFECNVLCDKKEKGPIEELDTSEDVWLPISIDLSKAIAVKVSGEGDHSDYAQIFMNGGNSDYFIVDRPYKEVLKAWTTARTGTRITQLVASDPLI